MSAPTFDVTDTNFSQEVLHSGQPVLVEFTATWCPPCKMLAPIVHQIAHSHIGSLRVGLLDADNNPNAVQEYGVMGLPTLILFVNGKPAERIVGYVPRERIEAKLAAYVSPSV
jgi:thioredoxin 1